MAKRPPDSHGPRSEVQALAFDGTRRDRFRVVAASESPNGTVAFDELDQPKWKWITELEPTAGDANGTFNQLAALDNPALALKDESPPKLEPPTKSGYDPYATSGLDKKSRR